MPPVIAGAFALAGEVAEAADTVGSILAGLTTTALGSTVGTLLVTPGTGVVISGVRENAR